MTTPSHTQPTPPGAEAPPVLGIDVSKATLDACLIDRGRSVHHRFANSTVGITKMLALLEKCSAPRAIVAMEATGPYGLAAADAAQQAGHQVVVLNPLRVLNYARACERRNKTDRIDAGLIARFASKEPLPIWQPLPAAQYFSQLKSSNAPARVYGNNPTGEIAIAGACEARRIDHRVELFLFGKGADAFDEIAVGLTVSGHNLAHGRNDRE